jgi:hypothetical protein
MSNRRPIPIGRLDELAAVLDRLRVEDLLALTARPANASAHRAARHEGARRAAESGRTEELVAAHERIERYVVALFNASTLQPGWMEANWGRPGTAADRAHLAASLRDAVTALLLEDVLPSDAVDELLGSWGALLTDEADVSR